MTAATTTVVGISQRVRYDSAYGEYRDELDHRLSEWVMAAGFIPVPIPNWLGVSNVDVSPLLCNWLSSVGVQGLILSGGNDIGQYSIRDSLEVSLLCWAEERHLPVLGVCRGMQMMGVQAGGRLMAVEGHTGGRHELQAIDSRFECADNVNSYHHYSLVECPEVYRVAVQSEDKAIEAMIHKELPWQAWMWHPEREQSFSDKDLVNFRRLMGCD